jgi:hypothetical protein
MYQGMVASVIGKFANTSAHTSYLFFVKDHFHDTCISQLSRHKKPVTTSSWLVTLEVFKKLRPVLVGPPIIY